MKMKMKLNNLSLEICLISLMFITTFSMRFAVAADDQTTTPPPTTTMEPGKLNFSSHSGTCRVVLLRESEGAICFFNITTILKIDRHGLLKLEGFQQT